MQLQLDKLNLAVEWVCAFLPEEIELPSTAKFKNKNEYSLYLKQQYCIEQQVQKEIPLIVILEDDVLLPDNFCDFVDNCVSEFTLLKGDLLFLGTCCNITARNIQSDRSVYYEPDYKSRCAHCYAVTLSAARTIMKHIDNRQCAYDFKLNQIIAQEALRVCYAEPGILQATEQRLIKSSLQL
jgi:GR25 family glycosyltransferase involved in LPS biosynthesis